MKPTSKNTGIATRKPVSVSAHCALSWPNFFTNVCASRSAPPDTSSICPNIAPSPTTTATKRRVPPIPFVIDSMTLLSGIPAAIPTSKETRRSATNACSFVRITKNKSAKTPSNATRINVDPDILIILYILKFFSCNGIL